MIVCCKASFLPPKPSSIVVNCSSFDSQALWVIDVLGLFFDMLSIGDCKTRHWQTSCRLVQEFNVCSVTKPID